MDILLMTVLRLSTKLVVQFKVDHISSSESFLPIKRSPCLHPRASIHLMTIIFKLLASDTLQAHQPLHSHTRVHSSSDCTHPALSDEGVNLIQNWLMNPTDQNIDGASHESGLHHCLVGLIDLWLPLSRPEAAALAREPEACLSLGGASIDSLPSMSAAASDESKSFRRQFTFSTIWDVDVSLREMAAGGCAFTHPPVSGLWDCPIGSGLSKAGLAGYDLDVGGWNAEGFSCRQVVETIIIQLAVFLPEAVLEVCRPLIQVVI
ncbi:unnamed protein product [Protopolystoma xenopodis]|uniref:Uncharacterized protein n=1 Tax=Protopolystoma xenopodis TaxID=117903 RepID=A0A448WTK4_9PLAT|nr:unnamed protein product [Protopolystoma xenopodis]